MPYFPINPELWVLDPGLSIYMHAKLTDQENLSFWYILCKSCPTGGRDGGLVVSSLDSWLSSLGLSPGRGHCVVSLGKTFNSHSAELFYTHVQTRVKMQAYCDAAVSNLHLVRICALLNQWFNFILQPCDLLRYNYFLMPDVDLLGIHLLNK